MINRQYILRRHVHFRDIILIITFILTFGIPIFETFAVENMGFVNEAQFPPAVYLQKRIRDSDIHTTRVIILLYESANKEKIIAQIQKLGVNINYDLIEYGILLLDLSKNEVYQKLGSIDGVNQISVDQGVTGINLK